MAHRTPTFDPSRALTTEEVVFLQNLALAASYNSARVTLDIKITVSATPPANPSVGDLWVDTS